MLAAERGVGRETQSPSPGKQCNVLERTDGDDGGGHEDHCASDIDESTLLFFPLYDCPILVCIG